MVKRESRSVAPKAAVEENVEVKRVNIAHALYHVPEYTALPAEARLALIDAEEVPVVYDDIDNTVCIGLSRLVASAVNPSEPGPNSLEADVLLGTDNTAPSYQDTSLGAYEDRAEVFQYDRTDDELVYRCLVPSEVGNVPVDNPLKEFGLEIDGRLCNRALFSPEITKDSDTEINLDITLKWGAA